MRKNAGRASAVAGLLVFVALSLSACGGSPKSSQTDAASPTGIPEAVVATGLPSGTVTGCSAGDVFQSNFAGSNGQPYAVIVKLGKPGCPAEGAMGLQGTIAAPSEVIDASNMMAIGTVGGGTAGVAYTVPKGEVEATVSSAGSTYYELVVDFTSQGIDKVMVTGVSGTPEVLQRH